MGGPWCVASPLSISLFHNVSTAAQSLSGQTPQEPSASEELTIFDEFTAPEEPAPPEVRAVPEKPAASGQLATIKIPPKRQSQPAEDEDVDVAIAVDDLPPAQVSICVCLFFPDCIGIPLSAARSERLPTQVPPKNPPSAPLRLLLTQRPTQLPPQNPPSDPLWQLPPLWPHNRRPKPHKARVPMGLGPRLFLSSSRCVLFIKSMPSSKNRVSVRTLRA